MSGRWMNAKRLRERKSKSRSKSRGQGTGELDGAYWQSPGGRRVRARNNDNDNNDNNNDDNDDNERRRDNDNDNDVVATQFPGAEQRTQRQREEEEQEENKEQQEEEEERRQLFSPVRHVSPSSSQRPPPPLLSALLRTPSSFLESEDGLSPGVQKVLEQWRASSARRGSPNVVSVVDEEEDGEQQEERDMDEEDDGIVMSDALADGDLFVDDVDDDDDAERDDSNAQRRSARSPRMGARLRRMTFSSPSSGLLKQKRGDEENNNVNNDDDDDGGIFSSGTVRSVMDEVEEGSPLREDPPPQPEPDPFLLVEDQDDDDEPLVAMEKTRFALVPSEEPSRTSLSRLSFASAPVSALLMSDDIVSSAEDTSVKQPRAQGPSPARLASALPAKQIPAAAAPPPLVSRFLGKFSVSNAPAPPPNATVPRFDVKLGKKDVSRLEKLAEIKRDPPKHSLWLYHWEKVVGALDVYMVGRAAVSGKQGVVVHVFSRHERHAAASIGMWLQHMNPSRGCQCCVSDSQVLLCGTCSLVLSSECLSDPPSLASSSSTQSIHNVSSVVDVPRVLRGVDDSPNSLSSGTNKMAQVAHWTTSLLEMRLQSVPFVSGLEGFWQGRDDCGRVVFLRIVGFGDLCEGEVYRITPRPHVMPLRAACVAGFSGPEKVVWFGTVSPKTHHANPVKTQN